MVRCKYGFLRGFDVFGQGAGIEILFRPEKRKIQLRNRDDLDIVVGFLGAPNIGVRQRMAEMIAGFIRMALDDQNTLRHGNLLSDSVCQKNS